MTNNYDRHIRGVPGPIRAKGSTLRESCERNTAQGHATVALVTAIGAEGPWRARTTGRSDQ
jgi:hypothetical protein